MRGMGWSLVLSGEVKAWLDGLDDEAFGRVACYLDLLAERGDSLRAPHSRRLGRNCRLRQLVVPKGRRRSHRLSYWLDGGGVVLVLTVGHWWWPRLWEVDRARAALRERRQQGPRRRGRRRRGACRPSGEEPA
jgi:hypothetical protein